MKRVINIIIDWLDRLRFLLLFILCLLFNIAKLIIGTCLFIVILMIIILPEIIVSIITLGMYTPKISNKACNWLDDKFFTVSYIFI